MSFGVHHHYLFAIFIFYLSLSIFLFQIHTNPCFFRSAGSSEVVTLLKDKAHILKHGDTIGLLPDKLFFKVQYADG